LRRLARHQYSCSTSVQGAARQEDAWSAWLEQNPLPSSTVDGAACAAAQERASVTAALCTSRKRVPLEQLLPAMQERLEASASLYVHRSTPVLLSNPTFVVGQRRRCLPIMQSPCRQQSSTLTAALATSNELRASGTQATALYGWPYIGARATAAVQCACVWLCVACAPPATDA
jgi:hypothetical protein